MTGMSRLLIWFRVIYYEVQRDMGESSGRVGRRKKRVVGRVLGCVYSLRSWASVGKQSARVITRQIGRCGKTSREREQMLACTPPPPNNTATLNEQPTTRLLAWERSLLSLIVA